MDSKKVGQQILSLRKQKGITQQELGERLHVAFQSVSKWERGETLPDTAILPELADTLETTIDNLLNGGERKMEYKRRVTIAQVEEGIACFEKLGELLGKDSCFYLGAIEGVDQKMNLEMEAYLSDPYTREAMIAEAAIQCMMNGAYIDLTDIKKSFSHEHWRSIVLEQAKKYGIK